MARTPSVSMYNMIKEELDDSDGGVLNIVQKFGKRKN